MATVKIKVSASTNKIGSQVHSVVEIDAEEWEGMSEDEKEEFCQEEMFSLINWDWETVD